MDTVPVTLTGEHKTVVSGLDHVALAVTVDVPDQRPATVMYASATLISIRTDTVPVAHTGADQTAQHTLAHVIYAVMAVVALTQMTVSSASHTHQRILMEPVYVTKAGEEMTALNM
jgi:hypothetical protein